MNTALQALRKEMKQRDIRAFIIMTGDTHSTEYVCEYFAARKYFSGFTGSAGTLVVLENEAGLWTDGRYFIQARNQLEGSGIDLMKMGVEGTPSIEDYVLSHLKPGDKAAFNGRVVPYADSMRFKKKFEEAGIVLAVNEDPVAAVWKERPALPATTTFAYPVQYAGKSIAEKVSEVRKKMAEKKAASLILTKLDEVAWLFNIRAHDIPHYPVALAYAVICPYTATFYINTARLDETSKTALEEAGVQIKEYDAIYDDASSLPAPVWMDPHTINAALGMAVHKYSIQEQSPVILLKACKNEVEIENTKKAHIKDGVACTKFMYWLKQAVQKEKLTECTIQDRLQAFRKEQENYLEDSFNTICAYKEHAAMMHYSATPENDGAVTAEGMLLVDSGGQYLEGTTDITRTFVLGALTKEEKEWFSIALRSHIRLAKANFLYGCRGLNLDILARGPLWDRAMDYQCGTGHGVGHLSNVHEPPNGFRWRIVPERDDSCVLEDGMIQSDEPGVYIEGKFGIRHENELLVRKGVSNEYGQFMHFEPLTFVPFDADGIDVSLLTDDELAWLNAYHQEVYEKISGYLNEEEKAWLKEATAPLKR